MRTISHVQLVGYLLWRGGLLLAGAGALYAASSWLLPTAVTGGAALIVTGFGLVMLSLVLERRADERKDKE